LFHCCVFNCAGAPDIFVAFSALTKENDLALLLGYVQNPYLHIIIIMS